MTLIYFIQNSADFFLASKQAIRCPFFVTVIGIIKSSSDLLRSFSPNCFLESHKLNSSQRIEELSNSKGRIDALTLSNNIQCRTRTISQSWIGQIEIALLTRPINHSNSQKLKERKQVSYNPDVLKRNSIKKIKKFIS